jgi:hypothetical protein
MHLDGLSTLLEVQEKRDPDYFSGTNAENEIADRYILLLVL